MTPMQAAIADELGIRPLTRLELLAALVARGFDRDKVRKSLSRALGALQSERVIGAVQSKRKSKDPQTLVWKLTPPAALEAANVGADILAAWFRYPREAFFKETRGAVEETFARAILYWLLVDKLGFNFEVAGLAMGRHRESVQNGCEVVGELYLDETKPEIEKLLDRFADDLEFYLERGGAYRRAADAGVAAVIAAANENAREARVSHA